MASSRATGAKAPPLIEGAVEAVRRIAARSPGRGGLVGPSGRDRRVARGDRADATSSGSSVSSDEVDHGKPAPDVYLEAAQRLGVAPAACLVVEDSLNGVRAGKAAGMTVVLIPNASVPPAPGTGELADVVLERLADLDPDAVV